MNPSHLSFRFTKMQGVGNDFVLIDGRDYPFLDGTTLAPRLCDRRFGIGADGLLIVEEGAGDALVTMRMFNPDGTPDICGNGLRCVARYVIDQHPTESTQNLAAGTSHSLTIETLDGPRKAIVHYLNGEQCKVTVEMGLPKFAPQDIPMRVDVPQVMDFPLEVNGETVSITSLSTGSTHTVLFVPGLPDDETFFNLSPRIENHPLFPERTSVMWTQVAGPNSLNLRIWERGAGETWGCGTGACAAAVAAERHSLTRGEVSVASKGGELVIRWQEGEGILMTGPAEYVFEGSYRLPAED